MPSARMLLLLAVAVAVVVAVAVLLYGIVFAPERLNETEKAALVIEAREILAGCGVNAEPAAPASAPARHRGELVAYAVISPQAHPLIHRLKADAVVCRQEGLYIRLGKRFAEEWGYFVPATSEGDRVFKKNTDPSYDKVGEAVYHYRIRG